MLLISTINIFFASFCKILYHVLSLCHIPNQRTVDFGQIISAFDKSKARLQKIPVHIFHMECCHLTNTRTLFLNAEFNHIYFFRETPPNPRGLCALSINSDRKGNVMLTSKMSLLSVSLTISKHLMSCVSKIPILETIFLGSEMYG